MENVESIPAMVTQIPELDTREVIVPPRQEEIQELRSVSTGVKTIGTNILNSSKRLGIGGVKLKPLNYFHARIHSSPFELMKSYGRWDSIKTVNLYTLNSLYKGIGSFLNITA